MFTTKIRGLAIAAVFGLSACTAASPAAEVQDSAIEEEAPVGTQDEGDDIVLPVDRSRLELECPLVGELRPC